MDFFEFVTTSASGVATRGCVIIAAGSAVNTCVLRVEQSRLASTALGPKDPITVWMVPQAGFGRFEVFRGTVSRLAVEGNWLRIEATTLSAFAAVDRTEVRGWENASVSRIIMDLIGMSRLDVAALSWPASLSSTILHVWASEGGSVVDEIAALLASSAPGTTIFGGPDGRLYIGDRVTLSAMTQLFPWPFDAAFGDTDEDVNRFPPLPVQPYSPAFDPQDGSMMGTVDVVKHVIDASGAYTLVMLNEDPDDTIKARVESEAPPIPAEEPTAEGEYAENEASDEAVGIQP